MIRSVLLFGSILAGLGAACAPPPSPVASPAAPPPMLVAAPAPTLPPPPPPLTCNAVTFLSKVSYLSTPFTPRKGVPVPPTTTLPANSNYALTLTDAFNAAPPNFQNALCGLDAVYVNAAACANWSDCMEEGSWGWLRSLSGGGSQRIVALSSWLWNSPLPYSGYETQLTQSALSQSGVTYSQVAPVDDFTTALVAALAHELGHIRWFEWINSNPSGYCNGTFFTNSWHTPIHLPPGNPVAGYWRDMLTRNERNHLRSVGDYRDTHVNPPQINAIDNVPPGSPTQQQMIYHLLVPAAVSPWPSLFGAMSPDEDFVETYKLKILTDPTARNPLASALITVPNGLGGGMDGTANILSDIQQKPSLRPLLSSKLACIFSY